MKINQNPETGFLVKCYPSGFTSATYIRRAELDFGRDIATAYQKAREALTYKDGSVGIPTYKFVRSLLPPSPLGSSKVTNSHTPRRIRGSRGIQNRAKRMVKELATVLEQRYPLNQLTFFTGTLPPGCTNVPRSSWSRIEKNFRQRVMRMLSLKGFDEMYMHVSEVQEKRFLATGEVAMHIHAVFPGRHYGQTWAYSPQEYQAAWNETVQYVLNKSSDDADWSATTNVQMVRKSVANYLGKYLSKGSKVVSSVIASGLLGCLPSSWYSASKALRTATLARIHRFVEKVACELWTSLQHASAEFIKWQKPVDVPMGVNFSYRVGWIAELSEKGKIFVADLAHAITG